MMDKCERFQSPSILNLVVSIGLALGIVVSYVPQHVRIVRRRSSEGISPWFLLLGTASGICAVCNILLLGKPVYSCCRVVSGGECFAASLGIAQITLQASMAALIVVLALIFARKPPYQTPEEYAKIVLVGEMSLLALLCSAIPAFYVYYYHPQHVNSVANLFGLAGAALAVLQYFPQIYTTATLQHAGSLSIPMMCLQTPGGFVWAASLAQREGTTWSSWLPYFTAATLQGIVLVMAVYFEQRNKRQALSIAAQSEYGAVNQADE